MKRLLNIGLLLSSFIGYLEWGHDGHEFIFQTEAAIFSKILRFDQSVLHPLVLLPFLGQLLLLINTFRKEPGRVLTFAGMACIASIMLFLLVIGIMAFNIAIFASTLPFFVCAFFTLRYYRKK